jgi:hypothetical protein
LSNTVSTKKSNAIFLATVLVVGTFAAISPSFIIKGVNAQHYPQYGMDTGYNSYKPDHYGMDNDRKSYESNSYGPTDYRDNKDRKSYGNDNSYESQYTSYGKDDKRDKSSKDSKKSVSLNKIKCINTNLNINGNNTGNVNLGNKGTAGGHLGAYSSNGGSGYDGGEGYYDDGYDNKRDKGFECIINNNNNNTNVVVDGGGNVTDGNGNVTDACGECFTQVLNATELGRLQVALGNGINVTITIGTPQTEINSLEELCDVLDDLTGAQIVSVVGQILRAAGITLTQAEFFELVDCIRTALVITIPRTLAACDINTAGDLAPSFSPPTIAQGTGDSSALEKIEKLKKQWLDLLP